MLHHNHTNLNVIPFHLELLTFSHVPIARDRAPLARGLTHATCWKTHQAHTILKLSLAMQFEQRNIVVQRLTVMVMMDICGGHSQCLRTRAAIFSGQVMITDTYIYCISWPYNARTERRWQWFRLFIFVHWVHTGMWQKELPRTSEGNCNLHVCGHRMREFV
jgi:hypothetical protein